MAKILKVREGDIGPKLSFTLKNQNNDPINLTGATVKVILSGGNVPTRIERNCTITDEKNGKCTYALTAQDTSVAGKFLLEVNIDYGGSRYTTVTQGELEIIETL